MKALLWMKYHSSQKGHSSDPILFMAVIRECEKVFLTRGGRQTH